MTLLVVLALAAISIIGCRREPERTPDAHVARALREKQAARENEATSAPQAPLPPPAERVVAARKRQWEASFGGEIAARPQVRARMVGLPHRVLVDLAQLPEFSGSDEAFLRRLATDTWRGLAELTDRSNGLPIDNVRLPQAPGSADEPLVGDYASVTDIGLYLACVVAASDLHLIEHADAVERIAKVLQTLAGLETSHGFFFNFYDTTSLERTSNFLSFVDSAWLTAGLILVRSAFEELAEPATRLIDQQDFAFLYDEGDGLFHHGYWVQRQAPSIFHYGVFYSEARLAALVAIGKGDVPRDAWNHMVRIPPPMCDRVGPQPTAVVVREANGSTPASGYYEWKGFRYVPSWGGSMFEALMPTLLIDEPSLAPKSLGRNDLVQARVQRQHALHDLGYPVWGASPCAVPGRGGYGEYGVPALGARGYPTDVVTPHASALALAVMPGEAVANLRELARRFPIYGPYGFYDAVNPRTGDVAYTYLTLDQAMTFLALANRLDDGIVRKRFASDAVFADIPSLLSSEEFPIP
jgi:hypothetical protein